MAFPQTPLPVKVHISLDDTTWTDITADVRADDGIQITRGRSDWGQQADAGRCTFSLGNTDGKYSPRNPEGVYYGQIGRNTPVRVSVETGSVAGWLPGAETDYFSTPDAAALDVTGDIDVRLDATLTDWYLADAVQGDGTVSFLTELFGKFNLTGNQRSWVMYTQYGYLKFSWSEDGGNVNGYSASSTEKIPVPASGRVAVRVALDVNNGSGGWTCRFYTAENIDGAWVQLGSDVTFGSTTSIFASTSNLRIGNSVDGSSYTQPMGYIHAAEVRSGIGGTLVADPDFTTQTSGATSFVDSAGRTWSTNGSAEITNRKTRFVGEVSSWTPEWDTGGFDVVTQVEAAGIMRRLGQGVIAAKSPMYREFTSPFRENIVAYWPMEDGSEATEFASALNDYPAMTFTETVTPANYSDWTASDPLPTITTGLLRGSVPAYTATNYIFVRFFAAVPTAGVASTQRIFSFTQTGTAKIWSLYLNTSGNLDLRAYDVDGVQVLATGFGAFAINGDKKSLGIELTQDGSDIDYTVFSYDVTTSTLTSSDATSTTGTLAGYTIGRVTEVRIGEDGLLNDTTIGHVAISDLNTGFASTAGALLGWNGETAAARVHRLGLEENFDAFSTAPGDEQAGPQARSTVLELMRAAEAVDEGILVEQRDILGIRHVQRASMYSEAVMLSLNYTGSDGLVAPLAPVDDDQNITNDVTVTRENGSFSRSTLTTGALSTQAPPNGVGLYDTATTLNLYSDTQPPLHAGWLLSLGTQDETRFPQVTVNLAAAPGNIDAAALCDVGTRLQITNPEVWLPPDTIDLLIQGYTESLSQFTWTITYNCSPYAPWAVAFAGGSSSVQQELEFTWADTEGSELSEALTTTETDVNIHTTNGPVWTSDPEDSPYDIRVSGEVMTVTAPGGLLNANPFFNTDTANWAAVSSTIARITTANRVLPHPRAVASLLVTPNGVSASGGADCTITAAGTVQEGASYVASMWVYSAGGWSDLRPVVDWYTSASAYISSGLGSATVVASNTWTYIEQTLVAPATASRVVMRIRHGGTPAASDTYHVWGARVTHLKASYLYDNFGRTSSSSWGTAESSQTWSTGGGTAADYNVTGGYGSHRLATVSASRRTFVDNVYPDFDYCVDVTTSATATGGSLYGGPAARYIDSNNLYQAQLEFTTANVIVLSILKRVAAVETALGTFTTRITHAAGTYVRLRFQGSGSTIRARAWLTTESEPVEWQVSVTDTSLTTSDFMGVRSIAASGNTNVNPEVRYDNLDLITPQTFTVTRSVNGVTKAQSSGADARLAFPAYTSL